MRGRGGGNSRMNFYAPIARRTRTQEALYLKAEYEKVKKNSGGGSNSIGRSSQNPNGENVRVMNAKNLKKKKEKEAILLDSDSNEDEPAQVEGGGSISLNNDRYANNKTAEHSIFGKEKQVTSSSSSTSSSEDEDVYGDEPAQVEGEGSISLNNGGYGNKKTAEHSIHGKEKQVTSSSEDEDVYGDDGARLDDVKGGKFDADDEQEENWSFRDNGDKESFSECYGRKSWELDRDEVKERRDSPMLEREKAKEAEIDPGRCFSVPISLDSEEDDEAAEIGNEDKGMKGGKPFASFIKESSIEESTYSSEDEEDSEGKFKEDDEDEDEDEDDEDEDEDEDEEEEEEEEAEEDERRSLKRKGSFEINVGYGCVAQRTRSQVGWRSSVKNGTNRKFETAKSIDYVSESSMDAQLHGVKEVEGVEMKDGGAAVKGGGIDFVFISSDTEDDLPDKCSVRVDKATSSSESEDGDKEDSDDTYEEGDDDEVHVEEEEEEEEEEGEEVEERSVERLKRQRSSGVEVSVSGKKDKNKEVEVEVEEDRSVESLNSKAIPDTFVSNGGAELLNGSNFSWKFSEKKSKNEEEVVVEEERRVGSLKRKRSSEVQVSVSAEKDRKTLVSNRKDKTIPHTFVSNDGASQLNGSNLNSVSAEKDRKTLVSNRKDNTIPHTFVSNDGASQLNGSNLNSVSAEKDRKTLVSNRKDKTIPHIFVSNDGASQLNGSNLNSVSAEKDRKTLVSNRKEKTIPHAFVSNDGASQLNGSNLNWKSSEKKSKKEKLETVAPPIKNNEENVKPPMKKDEETVTRPVFFRTEPAFVSMMDDKDIEVDGDEVDNGIEQNCGDNIDNSDDGTAKQAGEKKDDELGNPMKKMHVRAPKGNTIFNLFVNTIWKNGEELQQDLGNSEDEAAEQEVAPQEHVSEAPLPLKFNFGIQKPKPKEKSDHEKELDCLFDQMDFALRACDIGSFDTTVDVEDANEQHAETDPSTACGLGKHNFILDERIGIVCTCCGEVELEIQYVLPSMATSAWERFSKRNDCGEGDFSMMDGVEFQDNGGDCQGSSVHTRGTIWEKFPEIRKKMFPHQQDGFEFIWKNLAGGIDLDVINSDSSDGVGGCVISHAPGTGKTFLTIAFLYTYMEIFKECRPLIIAPCSMLLTWEEEFKKWNFGIPFHNLNTLEFSGNESAFARKLVGNKPRGNKWSRIVKLLSWSQGKSVLGISYNLFEKFTRRGSVKKKAGKAQGDILSDKECEDIGKILLEKPTVLVLDEGHTPRNERSLIWKALIQIKTERRIILSGTPFQNNFIELYNTLWLVRPTFADRISCRTQKNGRKSAKGPEEVEEKRGKWATLTSSIRTNADDEFLEELRTMIEPFVHVHKGSILQKNLPGLRDCVVLLKPPDLQKQLLKDVETTKNSFELEHAMSLVSIHSSLLPKCNIPGYEKAFIDKITAKSFQLNPNEGVKTRFLMEVIRLSESLNEKVLVFGQYMDPFSLIKDQLQSHFNWTEGKEVLQMDGKLDVKTRQTMINLFNDPCSKVKVLLASTRACGEGISLVGASRIVLLDVVWNPSVERQAISRAYRLGQKKVVYTYHLIASGTSEADKYRRQVQKDHLSNLVFSTTHVETDKQKIPPTISDDKILEAMTGSDKLADMFDQIIHQPKESDLVKTFTSVTSKPTGDASFVD